MRIKAKGDIKHHPYNLTTGDQITVPDTVGSVLVANGWAENLDTGESATPAANTPTLDIHGAGHKSTDNLGD